MSQIIQPRSPSVDLKLRSRGSIPLAALPVLVVLALMAPMTWAAPISVSSCQTLGAAGAYELTADVAAVDATCLEITASDVKLDLAGHTISCTGSGFGGSCQVPAAAVNVGVVIAPNLTGVAVMGPGTISGFDTGVAIRDSNALIVGITFTGPPCDPAACSRPFSTGIIALGRSAVNLSRNDVSNHAFGLRIDGVECAGDAAACVLSRNTVHDNSCQGILLVATTGYTLTRNVARSNGVIACFPRGGITLVFGSTANTVTSNNSSANGGFGIRTGFGNRIGPDTSGNHILNNTARGNTLGDLSEVDGANSWNDNNRCNTENGTVPSSVCNPDE